MSAKNRVEPIFENNYVGVELNVGIGYDNLQNTQDDGSYLELNPFIGKHFNPDFALQFNLNMSNDYPDNVTEDNIYVISSKYNISNMDITFGFGFDSEFNNLVSVGTHYKMSENMNLGADAILKFGDQDKHDNRFSIYTDYMRVIDDNNNKAGAEIRLMSGSYNIDNKDTKNQSGYQIRPKLIIEAGAEQTIDIQAGFSIGEISRSDGDNISLSGFFGKALVDKINSTH